MTLYEEIQCALNRASAEKGSGTPDFILARYLLDCLKAFDNAALARSNWYGNRDRTIEEHHRFDVRDPEVVERERLVNQLASSEVSSDPA